MHLKLHLLSLFIGLSVCSPFYGNGTTTFRGLGKESKHQIKMMIAFYLILIAAMLATIFLLRYYMLCGWGMPDFCYVLGREQKNSNRLVVKQVLKRLH